MPQKKANLAILEGGKNCNLFQDLDKKKASEETPDEKFRSSDEIEARLRENIEQLIQWIHLSSKQKKTFFDLETGLIPLIYKIGCLSLALFLALREESIASELPSRVQRYKRWFKKKEKKPRTITSFFGSVSYWRTYYYSSPKEQKYRGRKKVQGIGFFPLDQELGLTSDSFSLIVISIAARLGAMMPFATAAQLLRLMVGSNPSETAIEQMMLGLGAYTQKFFEQALAPIGDGEILVIMIDGKAVPTATMSELKKRRGKRKTKANGPSKRHRNRDQRKHWKPKKRRRKGDKSKNGKSGTLVVMYTLKLSADGQQLLGPINKRVFASFAPKRFAFQYARREAEKRGFSPDSNKTIQFVSDGDKDFPIYLDECFADYYEDQIIETLDVMHVMEYVWKAGAAHFKEGSEELASWVQKQKKRFFNSRGDLVVAELLKLLMSIPKTGPGTKSRRERTEKAIDYIKDNLYRMDYRYYCEQDLELASGAVEGAVKHVIGYRMDHGGMRWIVERAEAVLQLRCIVLNDQWDDFIDWYQENLKEKREESPSVRILRDKPAALPLMKMAA